LGFISCDFMCENNFLLLRFLHLLWFFSLSAHRYGWASHPFDDGVHKTTFNLKASADIDPSSLRAGVRAGLLPRATDDAEVHEHAHMHAQHHTHTEHAPHSSNNREEDAAVLAWINAHANQQHHRAPRNAPHPAAATAATAAPPQQQRTAAAAAAVSAAHRPAVELEFEQRIPNVPRLGLKGREEVSSSKSLDKRGRKAHRVATGPPARRGEMSPCIESFALLAFAFAF
jgi:hypothetical protein